MAFNRDALTKPGDPDSRGMFYNNLNEFDEGFYSVNGRFPSEKEATAYFMFVRAHEIDYFLRNINAVQEKWAKGIKKFSFKLNDVDTSIEGKRVDTVPSPDKGPADVLFVDPKTGKGTARQLTNKLKEEIDKLAKEKNYSVIQTYDGFIDETPVNFVVLKSEVENPISFRQVNYRPGFHSVYEAENKIVQPEIVRSGSREYYKGDKIAYMLSTRKGAEKVLENINHARKLLKDKNIPALTNHLNKTLPISVEDFTKGFGKGGFSLDAPFTMVRSGEKSINTDTVKALYPNASDFKENPYILNKGDDLTFRLERGRVIKELSPKADGVWGIEDAKQVDPVAVQNREMSRLIRNRFYEPLTTATANSFIEEFGKKGMLSMKGRTLTVDEMRRNPTWYFHNADIVTSSPVNRKKMELIRNAHRRLVGQPSKIESDYLSFVQYADGVEIVGVTGTRGKSMTTQLIYEILKDNIKGRSVYLGGNVRSVSTLALMSKVKKGDIVVMELDSWALHGMGDIKVSPHISVFTTFMRDHMNFYRDDMGAYFADKANIFKYQSKDDVLVIRPGMKKLINKKDVKGKLVVANKKDVEKYKFAVLGDHQRENLACAVEVAKLYKISEANTTSSFR
jgi:hypothetical protein